MIFKRLALVLCVLCPLFICTCFETGPIQYEFYNRSSANIEIKLNVPWGDQLANVTTIANIRPATDKIYVYSKQTKIIYVEKKREVDFLWTTSNVNDLPNVQCEVDAGAAIFRDKVKK